jgi:hypothetical protein
MFVRCISPASSQHTTSVRERVLRAIKMAETMVWEIEGVDVFFGRQSFNKNRRRCSLVRRGRSTARGRTVRDLAQGLGFPA